MATPDPESAHVKCAVTSPRFHPLAFGAGDRLTETTGGRRSMLKGALVTDAGLPARSVTVPETERPVPSVVTS